MSESLDKIDKVTKDWSFKEWKEFETYLCRSDAILYDQFCDAKDLKDRSEKYTLPQYIADNLVMLAHVVASELDNFQNWKKIGKFGRNGQAVPI